jgi:hypothetical protein
MPAVRQVANTPVATWRSRREWWVVLPASGHGTRRGWVRPPQTSGPSVTRSCEPTTRLTPHFFQSIRPPSRAKGLDKGKESRAGRVGPSRRREGAGRLGPGRAEWPAGARRVGAAASAGWSEAARRRAAAGRAAGAGRASRVVGRAKRLPRALRSRLLLNAPPGSTTRRSGRSRAPERPIRARQLAEYG